MFHFFLMAVVLSGDVSGDILKLWLQEKLSHPEDRVMFAHVFRVDVLHVDCLAPAASASPTEPTRLTKIG